MDKKEPYISVVMPVYNAAEYLDEAIESILNQTFSDLELILVDDCSPDNSGTICENWKNQDSRVKVIHLEKNGGAGNARNRGIDLAVGKYLTFVDSDDQLDKNLYEKAVNTLLENEGDLCVWGVTEEYYDQKDHLLSTNKLVLPNKICRNVEETRKMIIPLEAKTLFGYQWNKLYKMDIIKEHKIYFEKVHLYEDYFFNIDFIKYAEKMSILNEAGYYYKKRQNQSLTKQYVKDYFILSRRRIQTMYELHQEWGVCGRNVRNFLGNIYFRYILSALERNCAKEACMKHRDRLQWVKKLEQEKTYQDLCKKCIVYSKMLKILQKAMNMRQYRMCLLIGRITHFVKVYLPSLFFVQTKYK